MLSSQLTQEKPDQYRFEIMKSEVGLYFYMSKIPLCLSFPRQDLQVICKYLFGPAQRRSECSLIELTLQLVAGCMTRNPPSEQMIPVIVVLIKILSTKHNPTLNRIS